MTADPIPLPGQAYSSRMKTLLTKGGDLVDYGGKAIIGLATFEAYARTGALRVTAITAVFYLVGLCAIATGLYLQQEAHK